MKRGEAAEIAKVASNAWILLEEKWVTRFGR